MSNDRVTPSYPTHFVLDGVSRVGYDIHMSPFPGSLYAILEYLGNRHAYDYLMGVTGAAFRRLWNRDDGGNVGLLHYGDIPFQLAFDALGYAWRAIPADKGAMITAIQESLARGIPPISFGILSPPEAGIVTGYDRDGAVLYGWSYFQPDRSRYYEKSDWFETITPSGGKELIIIGDRKAIPSEREVLIKSLEWAIDLECISERPEVPDHVSGLAAYDGWADAMEVDADYTPEALGTRAMVYGDQCVMLEERRDAAAFLRRMKGCSREAASHLDAAAALYDEVAALGSKLWPWPSPDQSACVQPLSDPRARRELAGQVRTAREKEARAVVLLQKALAAIK